LPNQVIFELMKWGHTGKRLKSISVLDFAVFLMFAVVFSASLLLLNFFPQFQPSLMSSSQNILGIFTSPFVHKDYLHLLANAVFALLAFIFYFITRLISSAKSNDKFLIVAIWFSAILANLIYVFISPTQNSGGSSGLVSAFYGGVITFTFTDALTEHVSNLKKLSFTLSGVFLLAAFVVMNINTSSDTNVIVHLTSFSISVFLVLLYSLWVLRRVRSSLVVNL